LCFSDIYIDDFLNDFSKKMLSYRIGTVNAFHWGFIPVLSYSKPHTFPTFIGEEKETKCALTLSNQATI